MVFTCQRCGKDFKNKFNLATHLSRKNPCEPNVSNISQEDCFNALQYRKLDYTCQACNKKFSTHVSLKYHKNKNVCAAIQTSNTSSNRVTSANNISNNTVNSNNTNNNTVNNTFNVNMNFAEGKRNFGNERTDYITPEFIRECLSDLTQGLGKMVKEVYFNPEYPENHTVRLHSTKQKLMKIVLDGTTSLAPNSEVGKRATTKLSVVLRSYLEPMIDLLKELSEKEYDADERETFKSELNSAIVQLQWIRDHTNSHFNKDMTRVCHGRDYTRTCNAIAAHIIGLSKSETDVDTDKEKESEQIGFQWPSNLLRSYSERVGERSDEDAVSSSSSCNENDEEMNKPKYEYQYKSAFHRKSELTRENLERFTRLIKEATATHS